MIKEQATVIAVEDHIITVESTVKSTCSSCHQVDSCGSGQIAKAIPQKRLTTKIRSDENISVGDEVILGISEQDMLITAWQVYLWPVIGLITFAGLGQWMLLHQFINNELFAILGGFLGGYIGFKLASMRQIQRNNADWLAPQLVSVVPKTIPVTQIFSNK